MLKVAVVGVIAAFLLFYIMTSPDQAADIAHNIWKLTVDIAHGVGNFFNKLAS